MNIYLNVSPIILIAIYTTRQSSRKGEGLEGLKPFKSLLCYQTKQEIYHNMKNLLKCIIYRFNSDHTTRQSRRKGGGLCPRTLMIFFAPDGYCAHFHASLHALSVVSVVIKLVLIRFASFTGGSAREVSSIDFKISNTRCREVSISQL